MKNPVIVSIVNHKGGTGKTTTAYNLAGALAQNDLKILVIDLDQQANLTLGMGIERNQTRHIGSWMLNDDAFEDVVVKAKPNIDLIPAALNLPAYEMKMAMEPDSGYVLKETLEYLLDSGTNEYDFILLDCPPSLGTMTINALTASNFFLIPIQGEYFALAGVGVLLDTIAKVKKRSNPHLACAGVILSRFDARTKFGQLVVEKIKSLNLPVFDTIVRQDIRVMECNSLGQHIFEFDKNSKAAKDYTSLSDEIQNVILVQS